MSNYIYHYMNNRENNFDFLRIIAATLVMYSHSFPISGEHIGDPLSIFTKGQWSFGGFSVGIFFVISGFLIIQSYDRSNNIKYYLKSRILRIFPGLLFVIILTTFLMGPLITSLSLKSYFSSSETYKYILGIFLFPMHYHYTLPGVFTTNPRINGSLWTLEFEFLAYLIIAFMGIRKLLDKRSVLILFIINFTIALFLIPSNAFPVKHYPYFAIEFLRYFSAGMILYIFRKEIKLNHYWALICLIVLAISAFSGVLFKATFTIFGSYLIIYLAFVPKLKLLPHKFGDFSYGIYIYAFPIQKLVSHYYGSPMPHQYNFIISFPITLGFAIISWFLVEKPALALKKRKNVLKSSCQVA